MTLARRKGSDLRKGRSGIEVRLLRCTLCRACWPTERDEAHGGSRQEGEPCAYRWADGRVCSGVVHSFGYVPSDREREDGTWREVPYAYTGEWCAVLGVPLGSRDLALVRRRYRELAKVHHPDVGGDAATMRALNDAYRRALAELGA